jgi:hypothetical protein
MACVLVDGGHFQQVFPGVLDEHSDKQGILGLLDLSEV